MLLQNEGNAERENDASVKDLGVLGVTDLLPHISIDYLCGALETTLSPEQHRRVLQSERIRARIAARLCKDLELPATWPKTAALEALSCTPNNSLEPLLLLSGALSLASGIRQIVAQKPRAALIEKLGEDGYSFVLEHSPTVGASKDPKPTLATLLHEGKSNLAAFLAEQEEGTQRALHLKIDPDPQAMTPHSGQADLLSKAAAFLHA